MLIWGEIVDWFGDQIFIHLANNSTTLYSTEIKTECNITEKGLNWANDLRERIRENSREFLELEFMQQYYEFMSRKMKGQLWMKFREQVIGLNNYCFPIFPTSVELFGLKSFLFGPPYLYWLFLHIL